MSRDLAAGSLAHYLREPDVINVVMCEHEELDVLDPQTLGSERSLERCERLCRSGTGIDKGERLAAQQVCVRRSDRKWHRQLDSNWRHHCLQF